MQARVRRFAPAEFEGPPQLRNNVHDPLDRGRTAARQWLTHFSQHIQSTFFVCGVLYERFQPGGLAASRIGATSGLDGEGDYIIDCRSMTARAPICDFNDNPSVISMTAAQDVARFVARALDLPTWPAELRMYGQRMLVKDLILEVQRSVDSALHFDRALIDLLNICLQAERYAIQQHTMAWIGRSSFAAWAMSWRLFGSASRPRLASHCRRRLRLCTSELERAFP